MQNQRFDLIKRLKEYVEDELGDYAYYMKLSKLAPNENDKKILQQIAEDEKNHAATLSNALYLMTGKKHTPPEAERSKPPTNYKQALKGRIANEARDYKKYMEEYIKAPNQHLMNAFLRASTDENIHALKLLYLLS